MAIEDEASFDLDDVNLDDHFVDELIELSQEEEAMKVLMRLAEELGLANDKELIRYIYTESVQAHDNKQDVADVITMGRSIYEKISQDYQNKEKK